MKAKVYFFESAVRLGPKISETVKGKLSLEARVFLVGGSEKIFKQLFSFREGEKFLKACQCYFSSHLKRLPFAYDR
ncbi:hypothetical protein Gogos_012249 [Gossypium gossypioides]|uniref:Uncharacterized protein n=1 Tax=Gossypium gossypioides TaxID=34282 RepID=A0A7J9BRY3_GOSGO|nr:hypothetical protein [Gossypium gossypioides]